MIPLDLFNSDEMTTRRENAVAKAIKQQPVVAKKATGPNSEFFSVNQYQVEILTDADGQRFVECSCLAGRPPIDPETELPAREAQICYHSCAVLIWEEENGS